MIIHNYYMGGSQKWVKNKITYVSTFFKYHYQIIQKTVCLWDQMTQIQSCNREFWIHYHDKHSLLSQ